MRTPTSALIDRARLADAAGMTFRGRRDMYETLGYTRDITPRQYRERYERNAVANRIVQAFPKATWRGGAEVIEDEDPEVITAFEEAWNAMAARLDVWSVMLRADILCGLGRYSIILIGAAGDLATPLPPRLSPEQVLYLSPFSEEDARITELDLDPASPRFGQPLMYQISRMAPTNAAGLQGTGFLRQVHYSRVIHLAEGTLDDRVFGTPRLQPVWNLLDDLDKVIGGGAEAFWLRAHQGYVVSVDKDVDVTPDDVKDLKEQAEELTHQMRRTVGQKGVSMTALGSDVADMSGPATAVMSQISVGSTIPQRILQGSERGELASTQDRVQWDKQVGDRRDQFAEPVALKPLVDRLLLVQALPAPRVPYQVRWPDAEAMTETERASLAKTMAETNNQQGETVYTSNEIRDKVWGWGPLDEDEAAPPQPAGEPVAAAGDGSGWQALQRASARYEDKVRSLVASALRAASGEVDLPRLESALAADRRDLAEEQLSEAVATGLGKLDDLSDVLLDALVAGAEVAAKAPELSPRTAMRRAAGPLRMSFDRTNPEAVRWAQEQAAQLVSGIGDQAQEAIRRIVARSLNEGIPPRESARLIQKVIGLTDRDAMAVINLRFDMLEAAPGTTVRAGKVRIRVPSGGLTADQVRRHATQYADRLVRARALLVARTETLAASNHGQQMLWLQARKEGLLTGRELREWIVTPDDRLCPTCASMNGEKVGMEETFSGGVIVPPRHPGCRCAVALVPAEEARGRRRGAA